MNLDLNTFIIFLSIFTLAFFSIYLFHKGRKKTSNIILGIFFITQIAGLFNQLIQFNYAYFYINCPHLFLLFLPFILIWAPLFYLYVKSIINNNFSFKRIYVLHAIPFIALYFYLMFNFYHYPPQIKRALMDSNRVMTIEANAFFTYFFYLQIIIYVALCLAELQKHIAYLKSTHSNIVSSRVKWMKLMIYGYAISCFINTAVYSLHWISDTLFAQSYIYVFIAFAAFFILLFYTAISIPGLLISDEVTEKYRSSVLTESQATTTLLQIQHYLTESKAFLNPELSLSDISKKLHIGERYISQSINQVAQKNFYDFINQYRIEFSCRLLSEHKSKTILEILYDSGFNSKGSFNMAFKKHKGITPTEFRKNNNGS